MAEFSCYYNPAGGRIEIEPSYWDLHGVSSRIMWPRSLTSGYSKRPCKGYFRAYLSRLQMLFCRSAFIVHNRNKSIPSELMKSVIWCIRITFCCDIIAEKLDSTSRNQLVKPGQY